MRAPERSVTRQDNSFSSSLTCTIDYISGEKGMGNVIKQFLQSSLRSRDRGAAGICTVNRTAESQRLPYSPARLAWLVM